MAETVSTSAQLAGLLVLASAASFPADTAYTTPAAADAEIAWQLMITKGESVKGKAREGMIGSYFERTVKLRVLD